MTPAEELSGPFLLRRKRRNSYNTRLIPAKETGRHFDAANLKLKQLVS